jgi:hypothetical protein
MDFTPALVDEHQSSLERAVRAAEADLSDAAVKLERWKLYVAAAAYPEGSFGWVKGMLAYIDSAPGCPYEGSQVMAFEYGIGWDSPTYEELLQMDGPELAEALPTLTASIEEMLQLLEDYTLCSYCTHSLAKDD